MGNETTVANAAATPDPTPAASETPATFEAFLEAQPEAVKALYTSHSEGLLNTVKAVRDERDTFKKQLKELARNAEAGSEAQKQLEAMTAQLEKTERRAAFLEEAVKPEIQCQNVSAAWVLADAQNLFDKRGAPDWKAIQGIAPQLFGKPVANANAGVGTGTPPAKQNDMNAFIRSKTGRA